MRLDNINSESIKEISNQELLSLHHRVHQLFSLAKKRNANELKKRLIKVHSIIVKEMQRRGMNHKTPLLEAYLEMLFLGDY